MEIGDVRLSLMPEPDFWVICWALLCGEMFLLNHKGTVYRKCEALAFVWD